MYDILVVDDEQVIRDLLRDLLAREGYAVATAADGVEALEQVGQRTFDLVVTDLMMPRLDGMGVLTRVKELSPETAVIVITAFANLENAVAVMRAGAHDYIVKPFILDEVLVKIKNVLGVRQIARENVTLKSQLGAAYDFANIIGKSDTILAVLDLVKKISIARSNVLIMGESGTGKELVARAIHVNSSSKNGPFLGINCGAIPENLLESELFGYKKGAFTGAYRDKEGLFVTAGEGSLFLDEVGELPLGLQIKLLRALEERVVQPIGSNETRAFSARLIAATNKDLAREVEAGRFREDLYYRLNVVEVTIPPLRDRADDIPLLVKHFLAKKNRELGLAVKAVADEALAALNRYHWKGNIRELENVIERAMILCEGDRVLLANLPPHVKGAAAGNRAADDGRLPLKAAARRFEKDYIEAALARLGGDKRKAADELDISLASLYRKLELAEEP